MSKINFTESLLRVFISLIGLPFTWIQAALSRYLLYKYKAPGEKISVGSHHLHAIVTGSSTSNLPTILLEAGMGGCALDWSLVQPALAKHTKVLSYDRAGFGWSTKKFALDKIAVMGHSLGGAATLEAAKQDHRIKAAVLLDPSFHLIRREDVQSSVPVLLLRQEASAYREMAASMNETIAYDYIDGQRYAFNALNNAHFYRVKGAQHMSFSDIPLHYNDHHAVPVHTVTAEAATAFMEAVFCKGEAGRIFALQPEETVVPINSEGEPVGP